MNTRDLIDLAELHAPLPSREDGLAAWIRHYAAVGFAASVGLRHIFAARTDPAVWTSRRDDIYLSLLGGSCIAAVIPMVIDEPDEQLRLLAGLHPRIAPFDGEWELWLADVLHAYGVDPAVIDPDHVVNPLVGHIAGIAACQDGAEITAGGVLEAVEFHQTAAGFQWLAGTFRTGGRLPIRFRIMPRDVSGIPDGFTSGTGWWQLRGRVDRRGARPFVVVTEINAAEADTPLPAAR